MADAGCGTSSAASSTLASPTRELPSPRAGLERACGEGLRFAGFAPRVAASAEGALAGAWEHAGSGTAARARVSALAGTAMLLLWQDGCGPAGAPACSPQAGPGAGGGAAAAPARSACVRFSVADVTACRGTEGRASAARRVSAAAASLLPPPHRRGQLLLEGLETSALRRVAAMSGPRAAAALAQTCRRCRDAALDEAVWEELARGPVAGHASVGGRAIAACVAGREPVCALRDPAPVLALQRVVRQRLPMRSDASAGGAGGRARAPVWRLAVALTVLQAREASVERARWLRSLQAPAGLPPDEYGNASRPPFFLGTIVGHQPPGTVLDPRTGLFVPEGYLPSMPHLRG